MSDSFEYELGDPAAGIAPQGAAYVQCVAVQKDTSSKGNPMWVFDFRLQRYLDASVGKGGGGDTFAGQEFRLYCALTPRAEFKIRQVMTAFGMDPNVRKVRFTPVDVVGRVILATIEHDAYRGETRAQIGDVAPHPTEPGKKEDLAVQEDPFAGVDSGGAPASEPADGGASIFD